ncbi:pyridoxamine 5'-phosphate oxidase family protein [Actinophytocola algeriensis]|uniref:Putative pyridoxine 5'-phosphate oxidase superfamily flavin-nucleotide-binding protein n=1 Tax=Actinophytocola algeriensis TaxID=1768010 RepID=A0A7W7Q1P8_9PSEU|nr:pyridoxamine 5'-phosphate oxidase family protein [Actinophytocola algeriensis]MBB4905390.1 putative pyridoxine 5'-phosphate oxidase superfamily flavin-nucleotide-binding protein [Actinophytocola algeriensis]MBE1472925.1 putative pyridoxine 5'-phosphate oxidase superfamily flavin-nucleotide-binding protein [Actinophytocola algeriensis]
MRKVTTVAAVEAMIGTPPAMVLRKATGAFDDGCRAVLAHASVAGFGFRDRDGVPHTTVVGGAPGFATVATPTRLSFDLPNLSPLPSGGASLVFFLPGIGESLRVSGSADVSGARVTLDLHETWVHCGRCVLRSGLWRAAHGSRGESGGTLTGFLAASPFVLVSSWDGDGRGTTSPRGDQAGFVRVLDEHTLAIPDRRGNKRADTFRNLMTCDEVSLAALVPGRADVLHVGGTAYVSDDPALLSTMALKGKPPHAALVIHVDRAEVRANEAVATSRMWDRSAHVDPARAPDLMAVGARHLAGNEATASVTRLVARGLAGAPGLARRAIDAGYRKELRDEGY